MKKHGNTGNQYAAKGDKLSASYSGRCGMSKKNKWVSFAQSNGMSLQELMTKATDEYIKNHTLGRV